MARTTLLPARGPWAPAWWRGFGGWPEIDLFDPLLRGDDVIRVEEFMDGDTLVVRAEVPDVDPDKDVDVSISDSTLRINVSHETKRERTNKDRFRSEFRYGSFSRTIPLPAGTDDNAVHATYAKGVLEVRVPVASATARRIAIKHGDDGAKHSDDGAPAEAAS